MPSSLSLLCVAALAVAGCAATASTRPTEGSVQGATSAVAATAAAPALHQANGALQHLFSVSFAADRSVLATVTGLVSPQVARTATGGELELAFPPGVPYPQGSASVTVLPAARPDRGLIFDFLKPPRGISAPRGETLVTSHRIAGRPAQYLIVWRDSATGEHRITLFDSADPQTPGQVIARSRAPILGVASQPTILAADYGLVVWVVANRNVSLGSNEQVMVESYVWRPSAA